MRVLLFFPQAELSYRPKAAPLGLISIASFLNANGHEASICVDAISPKKIKAKILEMRPDMVGISVIAFAYIKNALKISEVARELLVPVVWGGGMASAIPEIIINGQAADYVSIGEGEQTWLEMANAFDSGTPFDSIRGLAFNKDGVFCQTERQPLLDLSVLPKMDWTLVDPEQLFFPSYGCKKAITIFWSKGCIGTCTFCYNPDFHCSVRRQRSLSSLIEEMRFLVDTYGADGFEFSDDLMFQNLDQLREFCSAILDSGLRICWTGYERIGIINTQEDFDLLYKSGCRCLMFGIETGSKRMQKMIHKPVSEEKLLSNMEMCHKAGIIPLMTFMLGLPGETPADLLDTVNLLKKCGVFMAGLNLYTPQPGTQLYRDLVNEHAMEPLKNIEQCATVRWGDKQYVNISAVPKKELRTVESYFRLRSLFFRHDETPNKHFLDTAMNVLRAMKSNGLIGFFITGFRAVYNMLRFLSMFLHPGIRKKYGLWFR